MEKTKNKSHNESPDMTELQERILNAAEQVFAQKGFTSTSIREITEKTNCNLAAVNYYFHGKEKLYIEVFRRKMKRLTEQQIHRLEQSFKENTQISLESLLCSFAEIFLEPFVKDRSGQNLLRLMMHERQNPHLPKGLFLNEVIQPVRNTMRQALLMICPSLTRTDADFCLHSIVAQLLIFLQTQDLFKGLNKQEMPLLDIEKSTMHIIFFSIGGIRQYLKKGIE